MKNKRTDSETSAQDINTLKQQVAVLKNSEAFFRAITQNSSDIIIIVNEKAEITYVNPSIQQFLGYQPGELIGKIAFDYFDPSELERAMLEFGQSLQTVGTNIPNAFTIRHQDGSTRILEGVGINLLHDPIVKGFVMNVRDITDRRKAEEELIEYHRHLEELVAKRTQEISCVNAQLISELARRKDIEQALMESEEKYRDFIDNAPIGVGIIDLSGTIQYINRKIEEAMGWRREDIIGKYGFGLDAFDEETRSKLLERFNARLEGDKPRLFELPIQTKDRGQLWVEVITTVLKKDSVPVGAQMVFVNITERKQAEEERSALMERLHRAEKMESLGTLAGGVAHDLNNVLGVLVGYTELMLTKMDDDHPFKKYLSNIMKSSEKATAIIQDLLTLARRNVPVSKIVNLNAVLAEYFITPEFERLKSYHPDVTFHKDMARDLLNVRISPIHLAKTVMNLTSNAVEAIVDAGDITVTTRNCYLDQPVSGYSDVREGDYVSLSVRDSGQGICTADMQKIFEPFYTKKVMGRSGTGLGLAVVWGTVKDHQGYIDVQSEPGKGSEFTIYLPATREPTTRSPKPSSIETYMGGGESVLVIDDMPEQREVATSLLTQLNYQVSTVGGGEEALEYLKNHRVDVLLLDMLMEPGIDGLETYRRILNICPKQKAIIVSGYSETDRVKQALDLGASAYIRKPYMLDAIGITLRKALTEASA